MSAFIVYVNTEKPREAIQRTMVKLINAGKDIGFVVIVKKPNIFWKSQEETILHEYKILNTLNDTK